MKTIDNIPTSKIQRATRMVQTGAKVGVNYLKYYGDKITKTEEEAKQRLNENNAEDIYDGLKKLKGSALKVAQMLSMEKSLKMYQLQILVLLNYLKKCVTKWVMLKKEKK